MEILRYRSQSDDRLPPRRLFLVRALTLGLLATGGTVLPGCGLSGWRFNARAVPPGRSIYRLRGQAKVNGSPATEATRIEPGDTVTTGDGAELIFVVGKDAFIVRERTQIEVTGRATAMYASNDSSSLLDSVADGLRVLTGKILGVFGERNADHSLSIETPTATVGIRGTGLYLEAHEERTYVCTCYGSTLLTASGDPGHTQLVTSKYHDEPYYILAEPRAGKRMRPAPVIDHTDEELTLIDELVGRVPPFQNRPGGSRY